MGIHAPLHQKPVTGILAAFRPLVISPYLARTHRMYDTCDMAQINLRHVPDDLRLQFKLWCTERSSNMSAELVKYMQKVVDEAEKRKERKR